MQTPFATKFQIMLFVDPAERAIDMMHDLPFPEDAERIGPDIRGIPVVVRW